MVDVSRKECEMKSKNLKQGDLIWINFNPSRGHEQKGKRPAIIISAEDFNTRSTVVYVCPISNTAKQYPYHVKLPKVAEISGSVLCQHMKSMDLSERGFEYIGSVSEDFMNNLLSVILSPFMHDIR